MCVRVCVCNTTSCGDQDPPRFDLHLPLVDPDACPNGAEIFLPRRGCGRRCVFFPTTARETDTRALQQGIPRFLQLYAQSVRLTLLSSSKTLIPCTSLPSDSRFSPLRLCLCCWPRCSAGALFVAIVLIAGSFDPWVPAWDTAVAVIITTGAAVCSSRCSDHQSLGELPPPRPVHDAAALRRPPRSHAPAAKEQCSRRCP